MAINRQVSQQDWIGFCETFSNGNRGRGVTLEVVGGPEGYEGQSKQGKLIAVDYDPPKNGNHIVVTTGTDDIAYSHNVDAPVELWVVQKDDGEVNAVEIIDDNGLKTILTLGS